MARRLGSFEKEAKELVKTVTDFKEQQENFDLCLQYVLSNFRYHKFLDTDSHKLDRTIEGLHQKFVVHAQDVKAAAWKSLVQEFLEAHVFEDEDKGRTDTHYRVLSLLIELADSPTTVKYVEKSKLTPQEEAESFDWGKYLLEGEDIDVWAGTLGDSSDFSDSDSESGDSTSPSNRSPRERHITFAAGTTTGPEVVQYTVAPDDLATCDDLLEQGEAWLERNIVCQYWRHPVGESLEGGPSSHRSSNLSADWDCYLSSTNPIHSTAHRRLVTEQQIVREALWVLTGVVESYVFVWDGKQLQPHPDVRVTHLTEETLRSFLRPYCLYGTLVWKLSRFIETVAQGQHYRTHQSEGFSVKTERSHGHVNTTEAKQHSSDEHSHSMPPSSLGGHRNGGSGTTATTSNDESGLLGVSITYQAFAAVLSEYLKTLTQQLVAIERAVCAQGECVTISSLSGRLEARFQELNLLQHVFVQGVEATCDTNSNSLKAAHLLGEIYTVLMKCDALGERERREVSLMLPIWIKTCKPYLDIIDEWISNGNLVDPHREFIIQRNERVRALDEHFWDTAFTLHCLPGETSSSDDKPMAPPSSSSSSAQSGAPPSESWTPAFLLPVLEQIILAGKSMEMLQNLGRLADVIEDKNNIYDKPKMLYEIFIDSLQQCLGSKRDLDPDTEAVKMTRNTSDVASSQMMPSHSVLTEHIAKQMLVKGVKDPLLELNFLNIFNPRVLQAEPLLKKEEEIHKVLSSLDLSGLSPVQLLLKTCLYPHITLKYEHVCNKLLLILNDQYRLLDYFAAMRRFYLMEAGDTMYHFYTELFDKVRLHEPWQDISFLNSCLQEVLQLHFPEDLDRLFVNIENTGNSRSKQPVAALEGLTLHYKVPWPVDVVLNSRCMKVYNQVFSFLLQIKRVKYCLDELRFTDLDKEATVPQEMNGFLEVSPGEESFLSPTSTESLSRKGIIHRMQIFRMRLMHFVNSLHNYIMTRILHSTGLEFQSKMAEAEDLDQVIATHNSYVSHLHVRCLLHKRVAFIKDVVTKVMNLALHFQVKWEEGVDTISVKALTELESEFSRCIHFLSSMLNNYIKRGSFPHLESLAFDLITSSESFRH